METVRIRDPESGMEKSKILDKHNGSGTLLVDMLIFLNPNLTQGWVGLILKEISDWLRTHLLNSYIIKFCYDGV
jgi:hypothetical protein